MWIALHLDLTDGERTTYESSMDTFGRSSDSSAPRANGQLARFRAIRNADS